MSIGFSILGRVKYSAGREIPDPGNQGPNWDVDEDLGSL